MNRKIDYGSLKGLVVEAVDETDLEKISKGTTYKAQFSEIPDGITKVSKGLLVGKKRKGGVLRPVLSARNAVRFRK